MTSTERLIGNVTTMLLGILIVLVCLPPVLAHEYWRFEDAPDISGWILVRVEVLCGLSLFVYGLFGLIRDKRAKQPD